MEEDLPPPRRFSSLSFLVGFGMGAFIGMLLAVVAVLLVRGPDNNAPATSSADSEALAPLTPTPTPRASVTPDIRPRLKTQGDVYLGPGEAYAVVGTMQRGEAVEVIGRDADAKWAAIRFPPGSNARGWVQADELEGLSDLSAQAVVIATPISRSLSTVTTGSGSSSSGSSSSSSGSSGSSSSATSTSSRTTSTPGTSSTPGLFVTGTPATPTPRPTQAAAGPTDLVAIGATLLPDGRVSVTIGNRGPGDVTTQPIFVSVRDLTLRGEQLIGPSKLAAGGTFVLQTQSFKVDREMAVQVVVDPSGSHQDPDRSNNTVTVTLSPPPTLTPTPAF